MEKTYFIYDDTSDHDPGERPAPRKVLGLFVGIPLLLPNLTDLPSNVELPVLRLYEIAPLDASDNDELAEFGLLNNKDRAIIRGLGDGRSPIIFARMWDESRKKLNYVTFDLNGTLVVPGPVVIEKIEDKQYKNMDECDNAGDELAWWKRSIMDKVKYFGHLTLNLGGVRSIIQLSNRAQPITMVVFLGLHGRFTIEKLVPRRFQQRTIVQRERETIQARNGLLALETFDHLLEQS